MRKRVTRGSGRDDSIKLPEPGDLIFVYDGGPGLVTRLEGWALSVTDLAFGEAPEAVRDRKVAVFRTPAGELDIATSVTPLAVVETSWHLVSPAGDIVNSGPHSLYRAQPSNPLTESDGIHDSGLLKAYIGAHPVYGVPATSRRASTVDTPGTPEPEDAGFTGASGGQYVWFTPEPGRIGAPTPRDIQPG
ncbi:hypothetical protein [Streptomyces sp. NPDC059134]|uniref:hypothetical protein n=1 Tax=Streptomyces sp. NPDC059134 TaxID=3346738 RepID=UPI0036CCA242